MRIFLLLVLGFSPASFADIRGTLKATSRGAGYEEFLNRARAWEREGYLHLALYDTLRAMQRKRPSVEVFEQAGRLALKTDRFEGLVAYSNEYRRSGNSFGPIEESLIHFRLALAAYKIRMGNWAQGIGILPTSAQVSKSIRDPNIRAKAFHLLSLAALARGDTASASSALQNMRDAAPSASPEKYMARLLLSQMYYEQEQWAPVFEELMQVTKNSPAWYPGVLVSAWAAYRVSDYNLSLGQLHTLHSPYFAKRFLPESHVLESMALFQLCQYGPAQRALKDLRNKYGRLFSQRNRLRTLLQQKPASDIMKTLEAYLNGEKDKQIVGGLDPTENQIIIDAFLSDPAIALADKNRFGARTEKEKFQNSFEDENKISARVLQDYDLELDRSYREHSRSMSLMVTRRAKQIVPMIAKAMEEALAVEVEVNTRIRDRLVRGVTPTRKTIDFDKEIKKGFEFWPFEGEYWSDEIGTYAYATSDVCTSEEKQ